MKKVRNVVVLGIVLAAAALPTVASAHTVNISANGKTIGLHSGPVTPPAHFGGLQTAAVAVDGDTPFALNVGP